MEVDSHDEDWGNETLDTGSIKKPAFSLGKKTDTAFGEKTSEAPKVETKFDFI